jgi:magnesium transporter
MTKKKKIGLSPGTLVYTGEVKDQKAILMAFKYNQRELKILSPEETLRREVMPEYQYWYDLRGIHDVELISKLGDCFNIHKLILEDILDPGQRIKIEDYDSSMFAIICNLTYDKDKKVLNKEQVAIYFTKQVLISFQEDPDDSFAVIRERMKMETSRIRTRNTDYLFYALMDYIVDRYYIILESLNEEIEFLEEKVVQKDSELSLDELYMLRNNIIDFKRVVYPLREEVNQIKNLETNLINDSSFLFIRDLQDNIQHIIESLDNQRELLNGIRELVMSKANLNMNKDMKWLTVVSTVSIPILFFTGVYGMNFEFMPELKWQYGYLIWWIGITAVVFAMIAFLKRKKLL